MAIRIESGTKQPRFKRWTAGDARRVLSQWRASGMSVSKFAKWRGVSQERIFWWKKRLADWNENGRDEKESVARFAPAILRSAVSARAALTIRLGEVVELDVVDPGAVSVEWFTLVLRSLSSRG
jgi:hypothetical protein